VFVCSENIDINEKTTFGCLWWFSEFWVLVDSWISFSWRLRSLQSEQSVSNFNKINYLLSLYPKKLFVVTKNYTILI